MKYWLPALFLLLSASAWAGTDSTYAARRAAYLQLESEKGIGYGVQVARLENGSPVVYTDLYESLNRMNNRVDCADFRLSSIIRLLYQYPNQLSAGFTDSARTAILNFKYWPDEPGIDGMCTWSENHHILFTSCGYLAGLLYPDSVFTNSGLTGRQMQQKFAPLIQRWLQLRYKAGFSEWLSNVYYVEDIAPLLNLVDFSPDTAIAVRSAMVLDLLFLDMALNQYQGTFGSTHGRTYTHHKMSGLRESTRVITYLMFGLNQLGSGNLASGNYAVTTRYRLPKVIDAIANAQPPSVENKQRIGINIKQAHRFGLNKRQLNDGMSFLTMEAFAHPQTINLMVKMLEAYIWWQNDFFKPLAKHKRLLQGGYNMGILPAIVGLYKKDLQRSSLEQVNVYTYKTPHYMLSTAQNYKPGYGGAQEHIWQATLGNEAVCFTTHPPTKKVDDSPGYWVGNGTKPKAVQVKNTAVIMYKINNRKGLYLTNRLNYTHAWLPGNKFDTVIQSGHWLIAKKDDGYLALWSKQRPEVQTTGEFAGNEFIAHGNRNLWVCEMGSAAENGSFENFARQILNAEIKASRLKVKFTSPTQGSVTAAYKKPLRVQGKKVTTGNYARYENNFMKADFPLGPLNIQYNGHSLILNFNDLQRWVSGYAE